MSVGLGSPPVRFDGFVCVVHGLGLGAHLCVGIDGSFSSFSYASAPVVGSECHPAEHQCYSCRFSPASGQNGAFVTCVAWPLK